MELGDLDVAVIIAKLRKDPGGRTMKCIAEQFFEKHFTNNTPTTAAATPAPMSVSVEALEFDDAQVIGACALTLRNICFMSMRTGL